MSLPDRILEAAELLFGHHGLDGASLRQICAAAGTRNNYAVQYHFTDTLGLVRAILRKRMPEIELMRGYYLARLSNDERVSTRCLLEAMYRPLFEADKAGPVSARFMLALHSSPGGWKPLAEAYTEMPITQRIAELLADANPKVPLRVVWQRLRRVSVMLLATVSSSHWEQELAEINEALWGDALDMAAAAMSVSVGEARAVLVEDSERYFAA